MSVTTFAAAQILRLIPRTRLSRAVGDLCERPLPRSVSRVVASAYARAYRVDMREAEHTDGYDTFDAFFTRRLRAGARRIDDGFLVSPADGRLESIGPVDAGARIFVKGHPYEVGELIGDDEDARGYVGGSFAVVYLSPRDYHRVHSPVDGAVRTVRSIPGDQYPVNSIGEKHVPGLFAKNQRVSIVIDTQAIGRVTLVMVGAIIVGRISVTVMQGGRVPLGTHRIEPAVVVERGAELGVFHLGSTVIVMVERGHTMTRCTGPILYGESLVPTP